MYLFLSSSTFLPCFLFICSAHVVWEIVNIWRKNAGSPEPKQRKMCDWQKEYEIFCHMYDLALNWKNKAFMQQWHIYIYIHVYDYRLLILFFTTFFSLSLPDVNITTSWLKFPYFIPLTV